MAWIILHLITHVHWTGNHPRGESGASPGHLAYVQNQFNIVVAGSHVSDIKLIRTDNKHTGLKVKKSPYRLNIVPAVFLETLNIALFFLFILLKNT